MVHVSIGGMQLRAWSAYVRIIVPTMKVLRAAKRTDGCLNADTFKSGDVFFAVSVWHSAAQMQEFARTGLHGRLTRLAMRDMAMFYNHSQPFDAVPTREDAAAAWRSAIAARGGAGTVGQYPG